MLNKRRHFKGKSGVATSKFFGALTRTSMLVHPSSIYWHPLCRTKDGCALREGHFHQRNDHRGCWNQKRKQGSKEYRGSTSVHALRSKNGTKIRNFTCYVLMRMEQHIFEHVYSLSDLLNVYKNAPIYCHTFVHHEQYLLTSPCSCNKKEERASCYCDSRMMSAASERQKHNLRGKQGRKELNTGCVQTRYLCLSCQTKEAFQ